MTLALDNVLKETCPASGKPVAADSLTRYRGAVGGFCIPACRFSGEAAMRVFESCRACSPRNPASKWQF